MSGRIFLLSLLLLLALPVTLSARTWYIEPAGTGDAPNIQAGIDSAAAQDTILLANGTYTGDGNRDIDYRGKPIAVVSEGDCPELCIIDCQGDVEGGHRGFTFESGEGPGSVLQGVTVTNGAWYGGGGGGISCQGSSPTITNVILSRNRAHRSGAGMDCAHGASPILTNVVIYENFGQGGFGGGGMLIRISSHPVLTNVIFHDNVTLASNGGGIYCHSASFTMTSCTLSGNSAAKRGGGLACYDSSPTLTNVTLYGNTAEYGSGIHIEGYSSIPTIENTIVAFGNIGGSFYCQTQDPPILRCCNLYGNPGDDWPPRIADQYGINGNFSACPSFCFGEFDDFRLCDQSPCAPGNHPDGYDCGLIGAWVVGCSCGPSAAQPATWGSIKAMYR